MWKWLSFDPGLASEQESLNGHSPLILNIHSLMCWIKISVLLHLPIRGSITQVLYRDAPPIHRTSERLKCLTLFLCQRSGFLEEGGKHDWAGWMHNFVIWFIVRSYSNSMPLSFRGPRTLSRPGIIRLKSDIQLNMLFETNLPIRKSEIFSDYEKKHFFWPRIKLYILTS